MNVVDKLNWLRRPLVRELVAAIALAAFFLTVLVPQGYMPSADGQGLLKLCSSTGLAPLGGKLPASGRATTAGGTCDFALAHTLTGVAPDMASTAFVSDAVAAQIVALGVSPSVSGPRRANAVRAPPSFA